MLKVMPKVRMIDERSALPALFYGCDGGSLNPREAKDSEYENLRVGISLNAQKLGLLA